MIIKLSTKAPLLINLKITPVLSFRMGSGAGEILWLTSKNFLDDTLQHPLHEEWDSLHLLQQDLQNLGLPADQISPVDPPRTEVVEDI